MGSRGAFLESGGFSKPFEYEKIDLIMGYKVIRNKNRKNSSLPESSNTSEAYISYDINKKPKQLRIYKKRRPIYDIDFDHSHHHKGKEDGYHVHVFKNASGQPYRQRSKNTVKLPGREMKKWESLINDLLRRRNG